MEQSVSCPCNSPATLKPWKKWKNEKTDLQKLNKNIALKLGKGRHIFMGEDRDRVEN